MTDQISMTASAAHLKAAGVRNVFLPDDGPYRAELTGFNTVHLHHPEVVVGAESSADVAAAIHTARLFGQSLRVVGLGHGQLDAAVGGIVITTTRLAGVNIDEVAGTARVGAGTSWASVVEAAAEYGLAPLCGSAPQVGVVGYLLGGGIGPLARTFGFAADHVRSIEMVTAAGEQLTVGAESHPDLFWALRGGKGGFGVVTHVTIDLFPLTEFYGGGLFFAAADTTAVLHAFSAWCPSLPEWATTSIALLRLPPLPELPEPLRGQFAVHLRFAAIASEQEAEGWLEPMRRVAPPLLGQIGMEPYPMIGAIHNDPTQPIPVVEGGVLLRELDAESVDALIAACGPEIPAPLAAVELRLMGGALSREAATPNAVGGRDAGFSLHLVGAPVPELLEVVVPQTIRSVISAMRPWATGGTQVNFFGNANDPTTLDGCWSPAALGRLTEIREKYDPSCLFPFGAHHRAA